MTLDNLAEHSQYVNVRNTFTELLNYGVIPVVNENVSLLLEKMRRGCLLGAFWQGAKCGCSPVDKGRGLLQLWCQLGGQ